MMELKDKLEKLEDILALIANQEKIREETKNNKALKKEIKEDVVLVLGRKLDYKLDITHEKQKELDNKMSVRTQNISTMAHNLSIMTQNQNTIMKMLQKRWSSTNHISNLDVLDQYVNKNESKKIDQDNKEDKETKYCRDDQNANNIFDKDKLDQDHNESQASIIDNKDDPYNDKRQILQYAKESKSKESDIVDSSSNTLEKPKCNIIM